MMSFLSSIRGFEKDRLCATPTTVTTIGGRQYKERKEGGLLKTELVNEGLLGFVGDVKPDLQVGDILPGLIMGSQDVAADLDLLAQHKVTHLLNVASGVDNLYPDKFIYKRLEILDIPETDITQYFSDSFKFINEGRRLGCVLVHCNAGISRSASIVIGYLMQNESLTYQEAYELVKTQRPGIRPNDGFTKQLKAFELQLTQLHTHND